MKNVMENTVGKANEGIIKGYTAEQSLQIFLLYLKQQNTRYATVTKSNIKDFYDHTYGQAYVYAKMLVGCVS